MSDRKGLLIRVGIDQTFGHYNAPINPQTNDYFYMPIPQSDDNFRPGMRTSYQDQVPYFKSWNKSNGAGIEFPQHLTNMATHLDPDFDSSTYGDQATGRGLRIGELKKGDFLSFFASFKPVIRCDHRLIYALYGIMIVDKVLSVADIPERLLQVNAHSRVNNANKDHLVVFANPKLSGRFNRAIPIGEYRNGSYRVTHELLNAWGGIGVRDGFIQRSVNPPWFNKADQFLGWLESQQIQLINSNWK